MRVRVNRWGVVLAGIWALVLFAGSGAQALTLEQEIEAAKAIGSPRVSPGLASRARQRLQRQLQESGIAGYQAQVVPKESATPAYDALMANATQQAVTPTTGLISGSVRGESTGAPLANVGVSIFDAQGRCITIIPTDSSGSYATPNLPPGVYYLLTLNNLGYLDETYDDFACTAFTCRISNGTPVSVSAGSATTGIDFALARGGGFSGRLTDAATGAALANTVLYVSDAGGEVSGDTTDESGRYAITGLSTGTYFVVTANSLGYIDEVYNNISCPGADCDERHGTPISVTAPDTTTGIDFALAIGGRISGTMTGATGAPLAGASVRIYDAGGIPAGLTSANAAGTYLSSGLPAGTYYARSLSFADHVNEVYDNIPCPSGQCNATEGTPIDVIAPNTTAGIDFALGLGGRISGTLADAATGTLLANVTVHIFDPSGNTVRTTSTNSAGVYTASGLATGTYYARTSNAPGYLDELYDNKPCPSGRCIVTSGTPIGVTAPNTTTGIDFALDSPGRISGTVADAATGTLLANVTVYIFDPSGSWVGTASTNSTGVYASPGLATGTYYARTSNAPGYLDELYDNKPCPSGGCIVTSGTPIGVTAPNTTTGIDFTLDSLGRISGSVTGAAGAPLANVTVYVYDASGFQVSTTSTNSTGVYTASGLATGTYHARTSNSQGYFDELYDNKPCPSGRCTVTSGTPIGVTAPNTTTGIDFALDSPGRISGSVMGAAGAPLANVSVRVYSASGVVVGEVSTDAAGAYLSSGLAAGTYFVRTANAQGYVDELYDNIRCPNGACSVSEGTPVSVTTATTTTGISFALVHPVEAVAWANVIGVEATGNDLRKTAAAAWGNAGAISTRAIRSGDGYVELVAGENTSYRMIGLSNGDTSTHYDDIDFALYLSAGTVGVYERGTTRGKFGSCSVGDTFRVSVVNGVVTYSRNGTVFYTSTQTPTYPLLVDTSLNSVGATIQDVVISGALARVAMLPPAFSVAAGRYDAPQNVVITAPESDAVIHYTTNGADPTASAPVIASGNSILIEQDTTLKARAFGTGSLPSMVTSASYAFGAVVTEAVAWTNASGVEATGNALRKTAAAAWGNAGAISTRAIKSGDGYVELVAGENTSYRMVGLSNGDTSTHYDDIDFALYLSAGTVGVYERGTTRGKFGSCSVGDTFRVSVANGLATYSRNGTVFYTSTQTPTYPLLVDASLNTTGATIQDVIISGVLARVAMMPPAFSVPAGRYDAPQNVVVTTPESDAVIHYTTNGTDPTASAPVIASGDTILVEQDTTLKARAFGTGFLPSMVTSARYAIGAVVTETVTWTNVIGVEATGNDLRKTAAAAWGNAGAISTRAIRSGDGYVELVAGENTSYRMIGLSNGDTSTHYDDIDFALYLSAGTVGVYERGTTRGKFGSCSVGDTFRVSVANGLATYSRNGTVFYTSALTPTYPLLVDTSLHTTGATIQGVVISGVLVTP